MADQGRNDTASLSELKQAILDRIGMLDDATMKSEVQALHSDLVAYHSALEERERSMQGALVELVDDMSQASQSLTETGTRLDAIMEAAEDVAFIIVERGDPGTIIDFSRGAQLIFGYGRDEVLGQPESMLCPEEDDWPDNESGACAIGDHERSRMSMRRKSGALFPALYSAYPLGDGGAHSATSLIMVLDMTKREMAEKIIRESSQRYKALALATPVSIITFDASGTVTFVNEWHMKTIDKGRMQPEFYIGKKIFDIPGILRSGMSEMIRPVLKGRPVSLEDVYVPAFGHREEAWHNIRLSPLMEGGELKGGILIREDVTRRKRSEHELKLLIDNSPIPLIKVEQTDMGGVIRYLNPEAVTLFGNEAQGMPVSDYISVIPDEDSDLAAMRGERCEVLAVDGPRQAIRASHRSSDRFEIQAVMDVGILLEAKEAAEDASRVKSDFIANISHEIRTPLNAILGMLQMLGEKDLGEELNEMTGHATDAARSLLALLNDILDFSVVEARALALDEQDFSVEEVMALVATPYRIEAAKKGLDLHCDIDPQMPRRLYGDARRLRQVIFHVIGNAVKFTDSGTVSIEVSYLDKALKDGQVTITFLVSDTGIGMTEKQMKHIFEPFRQADGSRTRRHGGTGIGLALVHEFVTAMGGTIFMDSEPGQGTDVMFSVRVRLPGVEPTII